MHQDYGITLAAKRMGYAAFEGNKNIELVKVCSAPIVVSYSGIPLFSA
jgi:hypothetical protein